MRIRNPIENHVPIVATGSSQPADGVDELDVGPAHGNQHYQSARARASVHTLAHVRTRAHTPTQPAAIRFRIRMIEKLIPIRWSNRVSNQPQSGCLQPPRVHGAWCGAWCIMYGAWCMAHGAWYVVRGTWCVVH
eukprot:gene18736-biopygen23443